MVTANSTPHCPNQRFSRASRLAKGEFSQTFDLPLAPVKIDPRQIHIGRYALQAWKEQNLPFPAGTFAHNAVAALAL